MVISHEQSASHAASSFDHDLLQKLTPTMRSFTLHGKVAIVTGGASGLGHNMAEALAEAGAKGVAILDVNEDLGHISAHLMTGSTRADCRFYKANVMDEQAIKDVLERIVEHYGRIDILINSAGIVDSQMPAELYPTANFQHLVEVNLMGSFLIAKLCAQQMITAKHGGSIILIASVSGVVGSGPQEQCAYNASKAGVIHLIKSMAAEWGEYGIRVNAISPGFMTTPLTARPDLAQLQGFWRARTPLVRLGSPGDLNGLAVYLASEASSYTTGSNMIVDGGYSIR